jgi:glycosyltransferase involved in cell wall biosynthesis
MPHMHPLAYHHHASSCYEPRTMGRLRVMHLVVGGDVGGAERLLVDLASRPDETGADHEVALFTPNRALFEHLATAGVPIHERAVARESPWSYLARSLGPADVAWLAALLVREGAHVLHTHTFGSHVLGTRAALRAGNPQVRTEHHVMHYLEASTSPFTRWAAARTDRFVAVSDYVRRALARTAPRVAARTTVVRNGVDTTYWTPQPNPATSPASPLRVAVVCRLVGWKRVHLAVEAAASADVDLLVVGDGEERARLEVLAARLGARVRFVGHQVDTRPWVASCDVTLSTARDEPLGLSVLESLSMERPVVAVAGGGIPEIVHDGETGALVYEASAPAIADALSRLGRDRAHLQAMGAAGRRFVVERCGAERMCAGYAEVYAELREQMSPS